MGKWLLIVKKKKTLANTFGHNFRLGEIESAIGIEQLKKLNFFINKKRLVAEKLSNGISDLLGLQIPKILDGYTHSYYKFPIILNGKAVKKRALIKKALEAEGVQGLSDGYICTHLLPMYQHKIAYGSKGFPWNFQIYKKNITYKKGICPVAENLHFKSYLGLSLDLYDFTLNDINLIIKSFKKVWKQLL